MTTKPNKSLADMAASFNAMPAAPLAASPTPRGRPRKMKNLVANPAIGERGDFAKVTFMLSPDILMLLHEESARRKIEAAATKQRGGDGVTMSAIVRDALLQYLRPDNSPAE
jgi:hypothetical protein